MKGAFATRSPSGANRAQEKSRRSLILVLMAVCCRDLPMASATLMNRFANRVSRIGSGPLGRFLASLEAVMMSSEWVSKAEPRASVFDVIYGTNCVCSARPPSSGNNKEMRVDRGLELRWRSKSNSGIWHSMEFRWDPLERNHVRTYKDSSPPMSPLRHPPSPSPWDHFLVVLPLTRSIHLRLLVLRH